MRGIPLAIKDLEDVRGLPTTKGCPLFGKRCSSVEEDGDDPMYRFGNWAFESESEDAPYVKRLRDAGAIIIGKTNGEEW